MPYRKNQYKVTVPHSSGFDKSHRNSGSAQCGTLVPILCDEVIPGTKVRLRIPFAAQLPPLASETYMNAAIKMEAFFVPMRLLCGSFESFFNDFPERVQVKFGADSASLWSDVKGLLPVFRIAAAGGESSVPGVLGVGSLADYLGLSTNLASGDINNVDINPLPFVAYHLIWQEWYRNPRVQNPAFSKNLASWSGENYTLTFKKSSIIPSTFYHGGIDNFPANYIFDSAANFQLADGKSIFDLRQRNFGLDYFTGARVSAQQGDAVSVHIDAPGDDISNANFTIAALRAANSLQQFRERNNLASPRFVDQIQDRYGVRPSDGVAQRPICIGSSTYDISTRGIDQTGDVSGASSNPFNSVASQYGRGAASGSDFIIDNFEALEPGYIMVLQSLVPEVSYTNGVEPIFERYKGPGTIVEMANPLLQNVGDEPILMKEIVGNLGSPYSNQVFGYTDRFAKFMFKKNSIHGLMRNGQSLGSFVLQRDFSGSAPVSLSSNFLEIPTNYLDQIFAVQSGVSGVGYWYDAYLDYKITMPLAEYSIPSLQDPAYEHGKSVSIRRNGQIF